jgi:hypothetical protein
MSINVAMDRGKEVVRLGNAETKVVKPVLRATKLSKQYGSKQYRSATVRAKRGVSVCWRRRGVLYSGGGLGSGNGTA